MRLPIISFTVFAVCFGLFGCTNGDEVSSMQPSLSAIQTLAAKKKPIGPIVFPTKSPKKNQDQRPPLSYNQNNSTNVLLFVTESSKIFTLQHSTKGVNITEYEIEGNSTLSKDYTYVTDFSSTCLNDNIYLLKYDSPNRGESELSKELDVIRYNGSNKFKIINNNKDIFDGIISITSDFTTGKIYWTDSVGGMEFSIKSTDKSFKKFKFIIAHHGIYSMSKLRVYGSKIFFLFRGSIYYTSNSRDSTPYEIFSSKISYQNITDYTIDYSMKADKLCWITYLDNKSHLYCAGMDTSVVKLHRKNIVKIAEIPEYIRTFVAYNNTFYWITDDNNMHKLYFKNGNKTAVEIADLPENGLLSIVPSTCPFLFDDKYPISHIEPR